MRNGLEHYFTFAGVDVRDFGAVVAFDDIDQIPRRVYSTVTVPGRNGKVYIDQMRYEPLRMAYNVLFTAKAHREILNLQNALLSRPGFHRLEDTYHPDEFYSAIYTGRDTPEMTPERDKMRLVLTFERGPERWLKMGETEHDVDGTLLLENPTLQTAKPLITVDGNGSFAVGAVVVTVTGNSGTVIIDCEAEDCWTEDGENANGLVSFFFDGQDTKSFPSLPPGANPITQGTVNALKIMPRWWRL